MSVLIILIPARARLNALGESPSPSAAGDGYAYVLSPDGLQVGSQGRARASLLPRADSVVAVLDDADVSWQHLSVPKAPSARLRAALAGVLEEQLLEDDDALHLALPPDAAAAQPAWVAVMNKAWLRGELDKVEKAGLAIERVVPSIWPGDAPVGHFFESPPRADGRATILLSFADVAGSATMPMQGTLARSKLVAMSAQPTRWTATPATAAPAERWLGASVTVLTEAERALQSARSLWNLRQFDLAARHRGTLALRDLSRRFFSPGWRPVRIGLVALAALQLVGLNAWAWQQRSAIAAAQREQEALLRATFPKLRTVLDAPLQMRRETDTLRAAAGRAGDNDLEALLGAAASAWPEAQGAVRTLRFEGGKLTLAAAGWNEQQLAQFRDRLRPGGWAVESDDGRVTLSRATAGAKS